MPKKDISETVKKTKDNKLINGDVKILQVRMDMKDYADLIAAAKASGISVSEQARQKILSKTGKSLLEEDLENALSMKEKMLQKRYSEEYALKVSALEVKYKDSLLGECLKYFQEVLSTMSWFEFLAAKSSAKKKERSPIIAALRLEDKSSKVNNSDWNSHTIGSEYRIEVKNSDAK